MYFLTLCMLNCFEETVYDLTFKYSSHDWICKCNWNSHFGFENNAYTTVDIMPHSVLLMHVDISHKFMGKFIQDTTSNTADMLQRDLLHNNSVYMVGSCQMCLLHIIHVSLVSRVSVLQRKLVVTACVVWQFSFKTELPPGLATVASAVPHTWTCWPSHYVNQYWLKKDLKEHISIILKMVIFMILTGKYIWKLYFQNYNQVPSQLINNHQCHVCFCAAISFLI